MNILIDIGHPAHVHVTKHFAHEMIAKGHSVLFTCRQKEFIIHLLEKEGFRFENLGKRYTTMISKLWGLVEFDLKMFAISMKFKPDIYISLGSMYAAQVSFLMRKPHICFEDTYNMEQVYLYRPFTNLILTGDYEHPQMSKNKEFKMAGYNELAYLHPKRYTPNKDILKSLGVKEDEKYTFIRFIAWDASHDIGHKGMTLSNKMKAVKEFSKYGKVFISSENPLPEDLEPYRLTTPPDRIHDVLAFASLVYGESSTMAEEAAMLGVPSIYIDNDSSHYTQHLEHDYQLMFNLTESEDDQQKSISLGAKLLSDTDTKMIWKERAAKMLKDRIDVTAMLVWIVENYPQSKNTLLSNPDYQYHFK